MSLLGKYPEPGPKIREAIDDFLSESGSELTLEQLEEQHSADRQRSYEQRLYHDYNLPTAEAAQVMDEAMREHAEKAKRGPLIRKPFA